MKLGLNLILVIALVAAFTFDVAGQHTNSAEQSAVSLREQLAEIQAREAALEERARQLDENLKPENIERSLAGVGSTKPEELRELRRRQLSIERESVRAQLKTVATSRERLESAIRNAETLAYQQGAEGTSQPLTQMLASRYAATPLWLILMVVGLVGILGVGIVIFVLRKHSAV
jgi:hypothetical protein